MPDAKSLAEFVESRKSPYAFEFFKVEDTVKKIPSFQVWAIGIDDYVMNEIRDNKFEDSLDTYQHILKEISKSIGLHQDIVGSVKMEKLYRWINEVIRPQRQIELKKKLILG